MARGREKAGLGEVGELKLMGAFLYLAFEARVGVLQLRRHAVELIGERLELVTGSDGNALAQVPAADACRTRSDSLYRNDHAAGQEQTRKECERKSGQ